MDQRLQSLSRQAAQGDLEAEAKLLLERYRAGELTEEKLKLAAYFDHEPARLTLGEKAPEVPEDLQGWVVNLAPWAGKEAVVRVLLAAVVQLPSESTPEQAIVQRAEDWVLKPSREGQEATRAAWDEWLQCETTRVSAFPCLAQSVILKAEDWAGGFDEQRRDWGQRDPAETETVQSTEQAIRGMFSVVSRFGGEGEPKEIVRRGWARVRSFIQTELILWALGLSDPVKDRVEARQREGGA